MKVQLSKSIFLISLSLLLLNATSDRENINAKIIENSLAKISENLYTGKYEVSNWLYRQFLNDLSVHKRTDDLKIATINTAGWGASPLASVYHTNQAYDDCPVVNITYEAANLFCSWLTEKYHSLPNRKFKNAKFELPTEQEWLVAAKGKRGDLIYATGPSLINKNGLPMANYKRTDIPPAKGKKTNSEAIIFAPVESYWENDFGIYNLNGNAAEMISEEGITKGGSFKSTEDDLKIDVRERYQASACNIGFRYFMKSNP